MTERRLPWHVDPSLPGYQETQEAVDQHLEQLIDAEQQHGALAYAAIGNEAADALGLPEWVPVELPEDAAASGRDVAELVMHDDGPGSAQAAFTLVADAHDLSADWAEWNGEENVQPLDELVRRVRAWAQGADEQP